MKSFKGTLVFAVIVAAIAGFAFFEFKKVDQEKEAERVAKHLMKNLAVTDVQSFRYTSDTVQFSLESKDGKWQMLTPVEDAADADAVDGFLRGVGVTEVDEVPSETVDWSKYGLDKPAGEIVFKMKNGKEEKIAVGVTRSFDLGFYLRMNEGKNLLVAPKAFESYVGKNPKEFRSRRIEFPAGDWNELNIQSKNKEKPVKAFYSKAAGNWIFSADKDQVLAQSLFGDYQRSLADIKGEEIVAESNSQELQKYGLKTPETTIIVKINDAKVTVSFSAIKDDSLYFTSSVSKAIYRLTKRNFESVQKTSDDFRDRKFAFQFDKAKVTKLQLKSFDQKQVKTFRKEGGGWTTDLKFEANQVLKQAAVDELVTSIEGLNIVDFPNKKKVTGLNGEIILLDAADQPQLRFNFGKPYKVKDNEYYLVKLPQYEENFGVGRSTLDELFKKEVHETKPEAVPAAPISAATSEANADKPPTTEKK